MHLHRRIARGTLLEHPGLAHLLLEQLRAHASHAVILVDVDPLLRDEFAEDSLDQLTVHVGLGLHPLDRPSLVDEQREQLSTDVLALGREPVAEGVENARDVSGHRPALVAVEVLTRHNHAFLIVCKVLWTHPDWGARSKRYD